MSYWYERISKKHILVFLVGGIPGAILMNFGVGLGAYVYGTVATASRILFDWIAVDYHFEAVELYPFVHMPMEAGCTEWLGFSSCENAQFKDWMNIYTSNQQMSVVVWNITNKAALMSAVPTQPTPKALPTPINLVRSFQNTGTFSFGGTLGLAMRTRTSAPEFVDSDVVVPNLLQVSSLANNGAVSQQNLYSTVKMSTLFESRKGGMTYVDLGVGGVNNMLHTPSKGTLRTLYAGVNPTKYHQKQYAVKGLLYFTSIGNNGARCMVSPACASQCTWSGGCEPLPYGHSGMLLPSGSFWKETKNLYGIAHWPNIQWNYLDFVVEEGEDARAPKTLTIINPETFIRSEYQNTGLGSTEKYPDIEVWLWKATKLVRTCGNSLMYVGKDCDSPAGYVNMDFAGTIMSSNFNKILYASLPQVEDGATSSTPTIYSEVITGLQMNYYDNWQMTAMVKGTTATGTKMGGFPLFYITSRPAAISKMDGENGVGERFTKDFQNYGMDMIGMTWIGFGIHIIFAGVNLIVILYGMSCIDYISDVAKKYPDIKYIE